MTNQPTTSKDWIERFSARFTDNILEGGLGNDLILSRDDVEPLMEFIQQEIDRAVKDERERCKLEFYTIKQTVCDYC